MRSARNEGMGEESRPSLHNRFMFAVPRPRLFVLHARVDEAWVAGVLRPRLGFTDGEVVTYRDFTPGVPLLREIERMITSSEVSLAVITRSFTHDATARAAEELAAHLAYLEAQSRFVVLALDDSEIPAYLRSRVRLDGRTEPELRQSLERLARMFGSSPAVHPSIPPCPYPGMVPFGSTDAARFFGRDSEVSALARRLEAGASFIAVIGASGSGKSSLLSAGLAPRLASKWIVHEMRPAAAAAFALAEALERASADAPLLWVIDQFEETFTTLKNPERLFPSIRSASHHSHCAVVITLRADFFGELMTCPLWPLLPEQRMEIAPLIGDALREAIQKPAEAVQVVLSPDLIERLIADARNQPGSLPFLQETLRSLWDVAMKRGDRLLRTTDYDALSRDGRTGLELAVADRAEAALAALPSEQRFDAVRQRAIIQRTLIRLIQFGDRPTRRQQRWEDLRSAGDGNEEFDATLRYLADQRLITTGENRTVDLAHEALIIGWDTLRQWIAAAENAEQARRFYEAVAENWQRLGRGKDGLLDSGELAELERWRSGKGGSEVGVSPWLEELIQRSRAHSQEQEARAVEEERQRTRSRERFLWALGAAFLLALVSVAIVIALNKSLRTQQDALRRQKDLIVVQRLIDLSRKALTDRHEYDERAALYARQAYLLNKQLNGPYEGLAYEAMRRVLYDRYFVRQLPPALVGQTGGDEVAISAHGNWAVVYEYETSEGYFDPRTGEDVYEHATHFNGWSLRNPTAKPFEIEAPEIAAVVVADDGTAAMLARPCTIHVLDLQHRQAREPFTVKATWCSELAISPSGDEIAIHAKESIRRISLRSRAELPPLRDPEPALALAYFPDGTRMATISARSIRLWSLRDTKVLQTLSPGEAGVSWEQPRQLRISAGGETLTFETGDRNVYVDLTEESPRVWTTTDEISGLDGQGSKIITKDGHLVIAAPRGVDRDLGPVSVFDQFSWSANDSAVYESESSLYLVRLPLRMRSIPEGSDLTVVNSGGRRMLWLRESKGIVKWDPLAGGEPGAVAHGYDSICSPGGDGVWVLQANGHARAVRLDSAGKVAKTIDIALEVENCKPVPAPDFLVFNVRDQIPDVVLKIDGESASQVLKPPNECHSFVLSPKGDRFACTETRKTLLWDLGTGPGPQQIGIPEMDDFEFSPDSRFLAGFVKTSVVLAAPSTGIPARTLRGHTKEVTDVAFSPDGSRVVSGSRDGTIRIWPREAGGEIWTLEVGQPAFDLAFMDHDHLLWRGDDQVHVLDLNAERMAGRICEAVARNMTEDEWKTASPDSRREKTCPQLPLQ